LIFSFLLSGIKAWQMLELKKLRGTVVCLLASFAESLKFNVGCYWLWRNTKKGKIDGG
jgi:hypothetical protein